MPDSVAGQERDPPTGEGADHIGRGRRAERRRNLALFAVREIGHVVQAAPADDADTNAFVSVHDALGWRSSPA